MYVTFLTEQILIFKWRKSILHTGTCISYIFFLLKIFKLPFCWEIANWKKRKMKTKQEGKTLILEKLKFPN